MSGLLTQMSGRNHLAIATKVNVEIKCLNQMSKSNVETKYLKQMWKSNAQIKTLENNMGISHAALKGFFLFYTLICDERVNYRFVPSRRVPQKFAFVGSANRIILRWMPAIQQILRSAARIRRL